MKSIAAREAKNRFGVLMDTAQREPVAIEKHGRAVAVMMSVEEYRKIKMERLHAEVHAGLDQLDTGASTLFDQTELKDLFEGIKVRGRAHRNAGV
ncbi:type II toxin-antitoxin system Phd/YefM family antitoxin [Mariprofundus sp. EBB-1]|uniref:type II toxin-antitoxin system Phd/YefM family antitoxin n=1 Tax=Mariprofundus sp. EBB-1 TaxID=2650971 RepID=UPI000EF1A1DE|nr:type II toxin-antitoxin system Phd/YefM family antitoxin [Mariprofundus sp. EBB-1]RLL54069.1 type II toxin-antitoxin system Phd/YefM family antitoxin [Mariprofundus sp. EBB-1]